MIDLSTEYLGLKLCNPLVVGSSPLCNEISKLRQMEDAGASAIVLRSLFEEEINSEVYELDRFLSDCSDVGAESSNIYPDLDKFGIGLERYLERIHHAKQALSIPVIASLNGISRGGWVSYAREMEQAGADAIELNVYFIPTDPTEGPDQIEKRYIELVSEVRSMVSIPVSVKVCSQFSAFANMARRLEAAGAGGIVIFNRFYQPDFDLEMLEVRPALTLSNSSELPYRLFWAGILYENIKADIAITGGVHVAEDVVKSMMAGARVTMLCSVLMQNGIGYLRPLRNQLEAWMDKHEYDSIRQMQGSMCQRNVPNPKAFQRANYMHVLSSYTEGETVK
jgi:dihydroorotate dehydrogenase (fumarate)